MRHRQWKVKVKVTWIYTAPSRETSKALRHGSHSFTCKQHHAWLYLVIRSPDGTRRYHWLWSQTSNCSLLLIYRFRKDERLSWPGWLTYSGRFTHTKLFTIPERTFKRHARLSVMSWPRNTRVWDTHFTKVMYLFCISNKCVRIWNTSTI